MRPTTAKTAETTKLHEDNTTSTVTENVTGRPGGIPCTPEQAEAAGAALAAVQAVAEANAAGR